MSYLNLNLEKEFLEKKIIITGASRGLGALLCKCLAERGAQIAMLSRSKIEMENIKNELKNSSDHISIKVDLLKSSSIDLAFRKAKKFLKQVDITNFTNNQIFAGNVIYTSGKKITPFKVSMWKKNSVHHQGVIYPRSLFVNFGNYNLRYMILSDYEMNLRAIKNGFTFCSINRF